MKLTLSKMKYALLFAALALLSMTAGAAAAAAAGGPAGPLPITPLSWIPIAAVAVLVVMLAAGLVYALSSVTGSANARTWSRAQMYEALLSLIMLIAFASLSYLFFLSPQPTFGGLGLVPGPVLAVPALPGQLGGFNGIDCTAAGSIFQLGSCDVSLFNAAMFQVENLWYNVVYVAGIIPGFTVTVTPLGVPGLGFSFGLGSLVPFSTLDLYTGVFSAFILMMLLQQIQALILSASVLIFSLFLVLGLVARTFGFTRTFGGAMIAFGLGLGFLYPLLSSITYGFIDSSAQLNCLFLSSQVLSAANAFFLATPGASSFLSSAGLSVSPNCLLVGAAISPLSALAILMSLAFQVPQVASSFLGFPLAQMTSVFIDELGYFLAGITFIPFLNFLIIDAFIIDFSSAIGERMDFMRLLSGII